jgi:phospholipid N-methyltransferase
VASLGEHARFLLHFLRNPISTGAVVPSSRYLAARMVDEMALRHAQTVVEIGPGTGAFTAYIARQIRPSTRFLAVELNPTFAQRLASKFPDIEVINDSAEHLGQHLAARGSASADCIVCSLPWAGFSLEMQHRLLGAIVEALRREGRFTTYAYIHAAWLPGGRRFRHLLETYFRSVVTTRVVWRNVPPALVYRCEK